MSNERQDIENAMKRFLEKYNAEKCQDKAARLAIRAAVQHNGLYRKNAAAYYEKEDFRKAWASQLKTLADKYRKGDRSVEAYEADIEGLVEHMREKFQDILLAGGKGFRISHAQKSLSVYLKHLWCMGVIGRPPQCPVDRTIFQKAGILKEYSPWTKVDTIAEHNTMIESLKRKAGKAPLSEWELKLFSS